MKTALITGDLGFIGRHLRQALEDRGWHVTGIDIARPAFGIDALDFFRADNTRFDLAVHCAAIVGGRASIDGSPLAVATNLALDSWYYRWLTRTGTPRAVYFSSSAAYPTAFQAGPTPRPLAEDAIDHDVIGAPDQTYGWAKLTGERLATHAEAAGTAVHIFRPFSGYGTDQHDAYPFPAFIGRARRREHPFRIWGSGASTRDWIHISDVVGAVLAAIDQDARGPLNLCTGRATSFDTLAQLVTAAAGYTPQTEYVQGAPQGVAHRVGDPARMLGVYRPRVSLEEGIRRALDGTL